MKLLLFLSLMVLPGSSFYRHYGPPTRDTVTIRVQWVASEDEAARGLCQGGGGCYFKNSGDGPDLIIAPKPKNFDDRRALLILGHEVFHALGATHD